jgi:hypothetical protein
MKEITENYSRRKLKKSTKKRRNENLPLGQKSTSFAIKLSFLHNGPKEKHFQLNI